MAIRPYGLHDGLCDISAECFIQRGFQLALIGGAFARSPKGGRCGLYIRDDPPAITHVRVLETGLIVLCFRFAAAVITLCYQRSFAVFKLRMSKGEIA